VDKSQFTKFNMGAFVDELEILINKSVEYSKLAKENDKLRKQIEELEQDQETLVKTKATEYHRDVETEVLVRLAMKLAPVFGLTMPENYESMVRNFLSKRDDRPKL
jgi:cell shape-determining protein MreC